MNAEAPSLPQHIRIAEAAEHIKVSKPFLFKEIKAGRLPVVRLAKRCVRIRVEDLEAYMRGNLFIGPPSNWKPVNMEVTT